MYSKKSELLIIYRFHMVNPEYPAGKFRQAGHHLIELLCHPHSQYGVSVNDIHTTQKNAGAEKAATDILKTGGFAYLVYENQCLADLHIGIS